MEKDFEDERWKWEKENEKSMRFYFRMIRSREEGLREKMLIRRDDVNREYR